MHKMVREQLDNLVEGNLYKRVEVILPNADYMDLSLSPPAFIRIDGELHELSTEAAEAVAQGIGTVC